MNNPFNLSSSMNRLNPLLSNKSGSKASFSKYHHMDSYGFENSVEHGARPKTNTRARTRTDITPRTAVNHQKSKIGKSSQKPKSRPLEDYWSKKTTSKGGSRKTKTSKNILALKTSLKTSKRRFWEKFNQSSPQTPQSNTQDRSKQKALQRAPERSSLGGEYGLTNKNDPKGSQRTSLNKFAVSKRISVKTFKKAFGNSPERAGARQGGAQGLVYSSQVNRRLEGRVQGSRDSLREDEVNSRYPGYKSK